jgi:hypothetical protein
MARSSVSFVLGTESLGQAAQSLDHVSGVVLYGTAPGSFATNAYQPVYSVADAESKGITNDYSDETKAQAIYTVSGTVTVGDTFEMVVTEKVPVTADNPTGTIDVELGTATVATAATATGAATDIAAKINEGTYIHGYTASSALGVVTIAAREGTGIMLNPAVSTSPLAVTVTGTSTGTITQQFGTGSGGATVGVYSKKAIWHYHISRFFFMNPTGVLWVGFFSSVSSTFADVVTLAQAAEGAIRQIAVFDITATNVATVTSNGTKLQARAEDLFAAYMPVGSILYAPNIKAVSDPSTLQNQQTVENYYVTTVIDQDGEAKGAQLFINSGVSITDLGSALGAESAAAVNQNIGEIRAFNISDGTEMAAPALSNGNKIKSLASSLLDQLDAYRYLFATTVPNLTGTYINNDWTNIAQTSPYYRISRNRVMGKAVRLIYAAVVPLLKSQIQLNTDGTISDVSIEVFSGAVVPVGAQMKEAGEISNMKVTISNTQNILSTGKIVIGVAIQPTVSADFIEVNMSFKAKL